MEDLPKNLGDILRFLSKYPTRDNWNPKHIYNHTMFNYMIENIDLKLLIDFSSELKGGSRSYTANIKDSDVASVYITERNRRKAAGMPP